MSSTTKVTMDRAGRLVIPKKIRDAARLEPGMPLEIRVTEGRVEIEPMPLAVRVERAADGLPVLVAEGDLTPVTSDDVRATLEAIRRERGVISE